jgi:hypothetical protein
MKKTLLLTCFLSFIITIAAQNLDGQYNIAQKELNRRGEVYFSFQRTDLPQLSSITN